MLNYLDFERDGKRGGRIFQSVWKCSHFSVVGLRCRVHDSVCALVLLSHRKSHWFWRDIWVWILDHARISDWTWFIYATCPPQFRLNLVSGAFDIFNHRLNSRIGKNLRVCYIGQRAHFRPCNYDWNGSTLRRYKPLSGRVPNTFRTYSNHIARVEYLHPHRKAKYCEAGSRAPR